MLRMMNIGCASAIRASSIALGLHDVWGSGILD